MGKGGTRFVGEAIPQRAGRARSTYTNAELRKNMKQFLETGVHPDLEAAKQESAGPRVVPLPLHDFNSPHVYLEISQAKRVMGALVIELFQRESPAAASEFANRCLQGSSGGFHRMRVTKVHGRHSLHLTPAPGAKPGPPTVLQRNDALVHVDRGAVSLARDGSSLVVALGRAMDLDASHQVVGRVHKGMEVVEELEAMDVNSDGSPMGGALTISACGTTTAAGTYDPLVASGSGEGRAEQAQLDGARARDSVRSALASGLARKRKLPGIVDAATKGGATGQAPRKKALRHLGTESSSSESDDDE